VIIQVEMRDLETVFMKKICIQVESEPDIAEAARQARLKALAIGFSTVQSYYIATAASELAANLFIHAGGGVLEVSRLTDRTGLELMTTDEGPGIADINKALQEGYSTAGGLGCGLPGVKRLMDELVIESKTGLGTVVKARKWI
jgi:serine/threonine-protein kinase RsbT